MFHLPPTVHGDGDHGFLATLVGIARAKGISGYIGDVANRWPAAHRFAYQDRWPSVQRTHPRDAGLAANASQTYRRSRPGPLLQAAEPLIARAAFQSAKVDFVAKPLGVVSTA